MNQVLPEEHVTPDAAIGGESSQRFATPGSGELVGGGRALVEDVGAACTQVALMDAGKIVFSGTPGDLIARGQGQARGDSPLERGYSAVLAAARS